MDTQIKAIVQRVQSAESLWKELRARWNELKLPGSAYSPQDFIACLMLVDVPGDATTVSEKVRAASELYAALKLDSRTSMALVGGDAPAILALVSANGIVASEPESTAISTTVPIESPPPITTCPHCAHDFAQCAGGAYATKPVESHAPQTSDEQAPFTPCVHVDEHGKCATCSEETTVECSGGCDREIVEARGKTCKNYGTHRDDCGAIYCDDCVGDGLTEYGFCDDCRTIVCAGCDEDMEAGTEKECSKGDACKSDNSGYCDDCAKDLLNAAGICTDCSGEKDAECASCAERFTESRVTVCSAEGCEIAFCAEHRDELDGQGRCSDCA